MSINPASMFNNLHEKVTLTRANFPQQMYQEAPPMADNDTPEATAEEEQDDADETTTDHSPDAAQVGTSDGDGESS